MVQANQDYNLQQVLHIEVLLDGRKDSEKRAQHKTSKDRDSDPNMDRVTKFLDDHPTAKIIPVINTHSLAELGGFVWGGTDPSSFVTCYMFEVSISLCPMQHGLTRHMHRYLKTVSQQRSGNTYRPTRRSRTTIGLSFSISHVGQPFKILAHAIICTRGRFHYSTICLSYPTSYIVTRQMQFCRLPRIRPLWVI